MSTAPGGTGEGVSRGIEAGGAAAPMATRAGGRFGADGYFCSATRGDEVTARRFAFTARIRSRPRSVPGDLLGGEDGTLAADPLRRPGRAHHHAAEARSDGAAHVLLHRDLQECLPTGLRRTDCRDLARTPLPTKLRDTEPVAPAGGQPGERREWPRRPASARRPSRARPRRAGDAGSEGPPRTAGPAVRGGRSRRPAGVS